MMFSAQTLDQATTASLEANIAALKHAAKRAEERAYRRQKAQELAAQGCPRCRGHLIQVEEPIRSDDFYEMSCVDCGEMWWTAPGADAVAVGAAAAVRVA
jgi:uncharacterized protein with PIN domain